MALSLISIASFGGIDADTDQLLEECFESHAAFVDASERRRFLIIGRKGSGKTAIFKKILRSNSHDIFTLGHTFRDYPWHHHDKQIRSGVPEQECFIHSWKYLTLIGLAKILVNRDNSQPWDDVSADHLAKIEASIIDTYGSKDPDIHQIFQPATKLKINPSFSAKLGPISASVSPTLIPISELPTIAPEINSAISEKIIESLNPSNKYFVLFDELDLGFDPKDRNYALRLIGLILAARDLNLMARDAGRSLNVIVFLRDDIYERLNFEDKNKLTEAALSRIAWDAPGLPHTLKQLMERRIAKVLNINAENSWDLAFDETKDMTGHQSKYQHITDRTMLRPRDMIKFSNAILESYKLNAARGDKFANEDIASALKGYSDYLLNELADEVFKHIDGHRRSFDLLRELEALQFDMVEFEEVCRRRGDLITADHGPKEILAELFEFSVIGFYQPGGGGYGGAEFVFRYKSPQASFNPNATGYQVHLGLQKTLGLKRYRRTSRSSDASEEGSESEE
jgi:hypothetical protein